MLYIFSNLLHSFFGVMLLLFSHMKSWHISAFTSLYSDDAVVPLGPLIDTELKNNDGYTLNYNEYIVYDNRQVRMKYLLQVRFNYGSLW